MTGNWTAPAPHGNGPGPSQQTSPKGPPYPPEMAIVGGEPSPEIDDPIAVVLLLLFLLSAAAHMAILRINRARNLRFVFSGMLFALCLLRGVSLAARVVWASYPRTVDAVIAASVMTQCGSVLIFVVNLFFAQRVLRAYHPRLGWHRGTSAVVWFLIACVVCCLVMAVVGTVHGFFALGERARRADRAVQLFAGLYLAFLAFLPVPVVGLALAARHVGRLRLGLHARKVEKFGAGRWRAKVGLLVFASLVATLGAAFRVGVNFDARPASDPAWFHSRACYYGFNFVTDLVVSTAYLLARFDRRFIVPDGAQGPGDYSAIMPSPQSTSKSNLVCKFPTMGSPRPTTMMRPSLSPIPASPTTPPPQTDATPRTSMTPSPSSSQSHRYTNPCHTDSSNTVVRASPATSGSFDRKQHWPLSAMPSTPPSSPPPSRPLSSSQPQRLQPAPRPLQRGIRACRRRSIMLRMRINSEGAGAGEGDGISPPDPAHLGPPILPALDLDLELLSATLLASWALDNREVETEKHESAGESPVGRSGSGSSSGTAGNSSATATAISSSRIGGSGGSGDNDDGSGINSGGGGIGRNSHRSIGCGGRVSYISNQQSGRARTL